MKSDLREAKYKNYTVLIILIYLWILVVNPQARFEIVGTLRVEKILIILGWMTLFFSEGKKIKFNVISGLVIVFFIWLLLSYSLSAYSDHYHAQHWIENYWKFIVLYFLILFAINNKKDIHVLVVGYMIVIALYQMHSWLDFLNGGSYVYQQGIKRMVGVWSDGIGAANYYGMVTMMSLPFAYYWYGTTDSIWVKRLLAVYAVMTVASVFFSGTRGALVGVLFFVFLNMRSFKQVVQSFLLLLVLVSIAYFSLPESLQYRYFGLIVEKEYSYQVDDRVDEISKKSAEDRMAGLYDGWAMAKRKPIVGFGPGTSSIARLEVNEVLMADSSLSLQLHNLYGQILGESGFVGLFIFLLTIYVYLRKLRGINVQEYDDVTVSIKVFLQSFIFLYLYYGMISHTLFRYQWFYIFAIHGAFLHILLANSSKNRSVI